MARHPETGGMRTKSAAGRGRRQAKNRGSACGNGFGSLPTADGGAGCAPIPPLQGTANHRAGNNQTGRRSGQFLVEQVFDCGEDARGDGVLRPTGLTFELGHPFRGLLPRRLAPSGDKLPRRGKHIVIRKFHHGGHLTRDPSRLNVWPTFGSSPPQDGRQTPSARHVGEKRPESVECNKISVTEPFLARPQVDFTLWQPHSTQKLCGAADHLWAIQNIALENRVMSAPQADHVRKIHVH